MLVRIEGGFTPRTAASAKPASVFGLNIFIILTLMSRTVNAA